MIGKTLGHYEITALIGKGGMGEVYCARDTRLGRDVAIKILPPEVQGDEDRLARLQSEARAIAALSHPNILAVFDLGSHDGVSYMAMELLDGEGLDERLQKGPIPPRKALELAGQIAEGLAAAHERSIVHRDLKPANIFITSDGRVKLLDFGLARDDVSLDASVTITQTKSPPSPTRPGTVLGTVGYMSPEQVRGQRVDARSDVFAFGTVLYEMLTGRRAFDGHSSADVLGAILRDEPTPLREIDRSLPEGLDPLLHRCLEKGPEERFQSTRDLAFVLRTLTGSSPAVALSPPDLPRARSRPRRQLFLALIGWVIAIMALATAWHLTRRSEPAPVPPRVSTLTYSGRDWAPSASPDGRLVAFVSDRDGVSRVWLRQMSTGSETPLTDGQDDWPRFSPDGSQILFTRQVGTTRELHRVPTVGGSSRRLLDDVQEADWSPDGQSLVFVRASPDEETGLSLRIADLQSGAERLLGASGNLWWYAPRWSRDGTRIAVVEAPYTGSSTGSCIRIFDVETGSPQTVELEGMSGLHTGIEWSPHGQSFIGGRARDLLSYGIGSPTGVVEVDLSSGTSRTVLWALAREPRADWGSTTYAVLGPDRLVFDEQVLIAELRLVNIAGYADTPLGRMLTTGVGRDRQPAFHPDGSRVLFSSNRSGNMDVWSVDVATGAIRQITDDPADDWDPAYTPDGDGIIWSSSRGGDLEVWMADADGSNPRRISSGGNAENPTMTADGEWVVYASNDPEHIGLWKVRPDGSETTRIQTGFILLPEVSPDGRYALYVRVRAPGFAIHVCEIDSGERVDFRIDLPPVARGANVVLGRARWTPDGGGIIYIDQDEEGFLGVTRQDFVTGRDTSASRRSVAGFSAEQGIESLDISPDGKTIVVSAVRTIRSLRLADDVTLDGWR